MTNPIDHAWSVMKAPIDSHGYSDLPRDMFDENVGIMSNQEEQDWYDFMAKLPFDIDSDLTEEQQKVIIDIFNQLYKGGENASN